MALTVGGREVRPLTADEVLRMVELGILDDDEPVELIDGVLTRVSSKTPAHEAVKMRLVVWLDPTGNADRFQVRVEGCLIVPDRTSLPEPDMMVVPAGQSLATHPREALLVMEVSVSSLRIDLGRKVELYAEAGVREYWVFDVEARRLEVFRDPTPSGYASRTVAKAGDVVHPVSAEIPPLDLAALFDGL